MEKKDKQKFKPCPGCKNKECIKKQKCQEPEKKKPGARGIYKY